MHSAGNKPRETLREKPGVWGGTRIPVSFVVDGPPRSCANSPCGDSSQNVLVE